MTIFNVTAVYRPKQINNTRYVPENEYTPQSHAANQHGFVTCPKHKGTWISASGGESKSLFGKKTKPLRVRDCPDCQNEARYKNTRNQQNSSSLTTSNSYHRERRRSYQDYDERPNQYHYHYHRTVRYEQPYYPPQPMVQTVYSNGNRSVRAVQQSYGHGGGMYQFVSIG